jgi:hypothetical protein
MVDSIRETGGVVLTGDALTRFGNEITGGSAKAGAMASRPGSCPFAVVHEVEPRHADGQRFDVAVSRCLQTFRDHRRAPHDCTDRGDSDER